MKSIIHFFISCAFLFMMGINSSYAETALDPSINDDALKNKVAKVLWADGEFKASSEGKPERLLKRSSLIFLYDTLKTGTQSRAQIVFTDNTLMTFTENSTLYVNEYAYDPKSQKTNSKYVMTLIEGGFRTITGYISKDKNANYEIDTPVATIGVRGTEFSAYYDKAKGKLLVKYIKGMPCVTTKKKFKTKNNQMESKTVCLSAKVPYVIITKDGDILTGEGRSKNQGDKGDFCITN